MSFTKSAFSKEHFPQISSVCLKGIVEAFDITFPAFQLVVLRVFVTLPIIFDPEDLSQLSGVQPNGFECRFKCFLSSGGDDEASDSVKSAVCMVLRLSGGGRILESRK